ncbi:hypothetical protein FCG40_10970 [Fimbriimonadia bacterium ATM]|nr:MAG: hypothetical protein EDM73_05455 [Armatimonadota bacterium]MBC6969024.1 hypothetical protein [Armatimonadota bacterium]MCE7900152.1 hypothetical protein [Armatimonadetes bacterium ATM1]MDL1929497.1 hypothetical protein [Fimbriimonadia bacterium ATM]RIJ95185.1 MAG: hypothetical protein DCC45_11330 [Armatimonadota bacterium]
MAAEIFCLDDEDSYTFGTTETELLLAEQVSRKEEAGGYICLVNRTTLSLRAKKNASGNWRLGYRGAIIKRATAIAPGSGDWDADCEKASSLHHLGEITRKKQSYSWEQDEGAEEQGPTKVLDQHIDYADGAFGAKVTWSDGSRYQSIHQPLDEKTIGPYLVLVLHELASAPWT